MSDSLLQFGQQIINGLTLGSLYAFIAIGYTMVYGIIGMINFAHGEIYMIGATISVVVIALLSMAGITALPVVLLLTLIATVVITSAYGWSMERVAYRPLRGRHRLVPLISAIGMAIFLQNFVQLSQGSRDIALQPLLSGGWQLGAAGGFQIYLSYMQVVIAVTTILFMTALTLFIRYSPLGRASRAVAEDRQMANLLGIDTDRVISMTFVIGAALAAVAGLLFVLYYGVINAYIGFMAGLKAFTAAVLGGIGSIPGAMLGGILLGLTESFTSAYLTTEYKDVVAFSLLVLILLFRPTGLLGKPDVEKV